VSSNVEVSSPLLTVPEAAKFLRAPIYSVRLLIRRGKLRYQRVGKRFVLPRADVEAYLENGWKREGVR
jgi:excisionase family DNA binding protein